MQASELTISSGPLPAAGGPAAVAAAAEAQQQQQRRQPTTGRRPAAMELPCPHCGQMLQMGPPLQAHIAEQHAGAAEAAKEEERQEAARQEEKRRAAAAAAKDKPQKLNPPRRQVAAFAALKTAVAEANKEVIAARKANMPDASRLPPSQRPGAKQ